MNCACVIASGGRVYYVCACTVLVVLNLYRSANSKDMHKKECRIIVKKNKFSFFVFMRHSASIVLNLVFPFKLHLRLLPAGVNVGFELTTVI